MRALLASVFLLGCSASGMGFDPADVQDPRAPFQIGVDAELADDASQAVALWTAAADGAYAPTLVIGTEGNPRFRIALTAITECGGWPVGESTWGCVDAQGVRIAPHTPVAERVLVIAHELGHTLGLLDMTSDTLMNAEYAGRNDVCVQAELVTAVGLTGPGACLE